VVLRLPHRPNLCVGPGNSILEILHIFLRLNFPTRLDLEPVGKPENHFTYCYERPAGA